MTHTQYTKTYLGNSQRGKLAYLKATPLYSLVYYLLHSQYKIQVFHNIQNPNPPTHMKLQP